MACLVFVNLEQQLFDLLLRLVTLLLIKCLFDLLLLTLSGFHSFYSELSIFCYEGDWLARTPKNLLSNFLNIIKSVLIYYGVLALYRC